MRRAGRDGERCSHWVTPLNRPDCKERSRQVTSDWCISPPLSFPICLSVCCQQGRQEAQFWRPPAQKVMATWQDYKGGKGCGGCIKLPTAPPPPQGILGQPHGGVWALPGWLLRHPAGQHTTESRRISCPCRLAAGSQWNCLNATPPTPHPTVFLCVWQWGEVGGVREPGGMLACCSVKGSAC